MVIPDDFPKTLPEFEEQLGTEEQCQEFLEKLRWPSGFACPACHRGDQCWINSRGLHECRCGHQTSVTAGTIFHGTHKPLALWFKAMFLLVAPKCGLSAVTLMRLMGFTYQTAWTWLHKLRMAMVRPDRPMLEGNVEIDESFVGGVEEGSHGRGTSNPLVACAVERLDTPTEPGPPPARVPPTVLGRARLEVIEDASQASLTTFAVNNVKQGSAILTDGLSGYDEIPTMGFDHLRYVIGDPKNAPKFLPGVHRIFSLAKRWLLSTHQGAVSPKHLPAYLHEYEFRFNRRRSSSRGKLFHRLAEIAVAIAPTTYRDLVNRKVVAVPA